VEKAMLELKPDNHDSKCLEKCNSKGALDACALEASVMGLPNLDLGFAHYV